MMNDCIKTYNTDKYRLYGDIMCHEWDTGTGIQYSATIGESNNDTKPTNLIEGFKPDKIVNQGHLNRMIKTLTTYPQIAAANVDPAAPKLVTSQQIVGHCVPFLLSNPSGDGSSGLRMNTTAQISDNSTITVRACIGWFSTTSFPAITGITSGNPCRIYLPSVNFNNDYIKSIVENPQYSLKYMDYYIDSDLNKKHGDQISRLFNVQLSRVRTLYIIPYLSSSTGAFPSPTNSPISSAPITCTPCRLKNFNIQIGGSNIISESQNYNYQFYNNNTLSIMADINGNSFKSVVK